MPSLSLAGWMVVGASFDALHLLYQHHSLCPNIPCILAPPQTPSQPGTQPRQLSPSVGMELAVATSTLAAVALATAGCQSEGWPCLPAHWQGWCQAFQPAAPTVNLANYCNHSSPVGYDDSKAEAGFAHQSSCSNPSSATTGGCP